MNPSACRFAWYELMTTDAPAAARFYSEVIGWTAADSGMPGMDYTLLSAGPHMVAGLMALPDELRQAGVPPCWTGYIGVADVDAKAAELQAAGGQVQRPPEDIPGVGRFAVVTDPHGAAFCLYSENAPPEGPAAAPGLPGTIGWHELMAGDLAGAWRFYSTLFGWTADEAIDMGPMGTYQLFGTGAGTPAFGGMMTRPPQLPVACWQYYVNVPAIDAAVARVTAGGGQVVNGPMQVPGGSWVANCSDPQGAFFSMVAPQR